MEYIRKQSLLADLNETTPHSYFAFETMVRAYPTEDVAPVIHAHWTYEIDDLFPADSMMICSNCGEYERLGANDNYCGNCGAKMDEGRNDG